MPGPLKDRAGEGVVLLAGFSTQAGAIVDARFICFGALRPYGRIILAIRPVNLTDNSNAARIVSAGEYRDGPKSARRRHDLKRSVLLQCGLKPVSKLDPLKRRNGALGFCCFDNGVHFFKVTCIISAIPAR